MAIVRRIAIWVGLILLGLWVLTRLFAWGQCSWYGHETLRETRYATFIGCMVKVNDNWVPRSELRTQQ